MKAAARKAIRDSLLCGYKHHPYQMEQQMHDYFLYEKGDSSISGIINIDTYADVLAPQRLRAMKNGVICAVAVISRTAIANGLESEVSFALSDYYLNEIELTENARQLEELTQEIREMYRELMRDEQVLEHSLPVTKALQYIRRNIYEPCRVADIAAYLKLNAQYFAVLFKSEMKTEPSVYINAQKMKEARSLLFQSQQSVAEIAEALGYCSSSHFVKRFKQFYGVTPKQMLKNGQ